MAQSVATPLVFFPGTLCDERIFMPLWSALNSEGNLLENKAFVPLQWAQDLAQMLALSEDRMDYFSSKVHLVGYSMGGYIAALVALANPQKVASLTLISSSANTLADTELTQRNMLLTAIKNKQYKGMSNARIDFMLHPQNTHLNDIKQVIRDMADDLGPSVLAAQAKASSARKNLSKRLAAQPFMSHFIVGEEDKIAPPSEIKMNVSELPQFTYDVIAQAGHMLPLEQTAQLANCMLRNFD